MNQIEQRINKLEKSLRYYRLFFGFSVFALIAVVLMSSGKKNDVPDIIKAKAFQVVDDYGNTLVLMNKEKGNGQVATYSTSGEKLVRLFTSDGGAGAINTFDANGKLNFKITRTTEGGGYMALYNSEVNEVMEVGCTKSNAGYLQINDNNAKKLVWLTKTADGGGYISCSNHENETIVLSTPDVGGRFSIYNRADVRIGYLGAQDNQDCNLSIYTKSGSRIGGFPNY
jgi:preprotein translocase subunit SecG